MCARNHTNSRMLDLIHVWSNKEQEVKCAQQMVECSTWFMYGFINNIKVVYP